MPKAKELTIEQKLKLLTGKNMWQTEDFEGDIDSIFMSDGPHGIRKMDKNPLGYYQNIPSNAYPNLVNIANSWDVKVAMGISECIAEDAIEKNVDIVLGPGVNIKRTPLCGRNFEYFSEDPYLAGIMAKNYIAGLHRKGVSACVKHFCANNRELGRYCTSSELSERALHEIYLPAFEIALSANPEAVMSSYNPVNGVYAAENKKLLIDVLRNQMKFNGLVISDWMGVHNSYKALKAGTDLRMPYDERAFDELKTAYDKKLISNEEINRAVSKILYTIRKIRTLQETRKIERSTEDRLKAATILAKDTVVLLKNNDNLLPLKRAKSVCVIGELNVHPHIGGGGAAEVLSNRLQTPLNTLLSEKLSVNVPCTHKNYLDGCNPSHVDREALLLASQNDISIVLVGNDHNTETEGKDRESIRLSAKEETLIKGVARTSTNTVVIIEAGSAIDMSNWIDDVEAVIFAGFLGDTCNEALADILTGKVCPSGKLSETFPLSLEQTYCKNNVGNDSVEVYDDGVLVGYRYYDTKKIPVLFPFGFGLSYAKFEYSDLRVEKITETDFNVKFTITNTSDIDAKEIAQIYIKDPVCCVFKPEKELKAFTKVLLPAKSSKEVCVSLDKTAFSHYDVISDDKYIENGEFIIMVGANVNDIKLKQKIIISLPDETQYSAY